MYFQLLPLIPLWPVLEVRSFCTLDSEGLPSLWAPIISWSQNNRWPLKLHGYTWASIGKYFNNTGNYALHSVMHYALHFALYYALHYVLLYTVQYAIHFALHYALRYVLHYALHCTLHYSLHNQFIINNCWPSVPLPCGQYMAIFFYCE